MLGWSIAAPDSVMLNDRRILIPMTQSNIHNRAPSSKLARPCHSCTLLPPPPEAFVRDISVISGLIITPAVFNQAASTDSRIEMNHTAHMVFILRQARSIKTRASKQNNEQKSRRAEDEKA